MHMRGRKWQETGETEFLAHSELADVADQSQVIPEAVRSRAVRTPDVHSVHSNNDNLQHGSTRWTEKNCATFIFETSFETDYFLHFFLTIPIRNDQRRHIFLMQHLKTSL